MNTFDPTFSLRPLSPSQKASFDYDPEQWYRSYILGERQSSKEMTFGSMIDKKIQDDLTFMPKLPRYEKMQHKMQVVFKDIHLVGVADGINLIKSKELADYKTGKKEWTLKRAKDTGQLKFYLLMLYITEKINPEEFDCYIHWLPTEETPDFRIDLISQTDFKTFKVKHTLTDILNYAQDILDTVKKMEEYYIYKTTKV